MLVLSITMNSRKNKNKNRRLVTLQTLTNNYVPRTCAELVHTVKDTGEPWGGGGGRGLGGGGGSGRGQAAGRGWGGGAGHKGDRMGVKMSK